MFGFVPARAVVLTFHRVWIGEKWNWQFAAGCYQSAIAPYIFGTLICLAARHKSKDQERSTGRESLVIALFFAPTAIAFAIMLTSDIAMQTWIRPREIIFAVLPWLFVAHALVGIYRGPRGRDCIKCLAATAYATWFTIVICLESIVPFGLYIADAGAILIAIGAFNELRARTLASIPRTALQLITANPTFVDTDPTKCTYCGYTITHLTTPRCPECGQHCTIPTDAHATD